MTKLKNKEKLVSAIGTLFHSWGSDTPQEVVWGANELVEFFNLEFGTEIPQFEYDSYCTNYEEVIDYINTEL